MGELQWTTAQFRNTSMRLTKIIQGGKCFVGFLVSPTRRNVRTAAKNAATATKHRTSSVPPLPMRLRENTFKVVATPERIVERQDNTVDGDNGNANSCDGSYR